LNMIFEAFSMKKWLEFVLEMAIWSVIYGCLWMTAKIKNTS